MHTLSCQDLSYLTFINDLGAKTQKKSLWVFIMKNRLAGIKQKADLKQ